MWSAGTAAPSAFLLAGYQQVGQFLYVVGGFSSTGPNGKVLAEQSSVLNRGRQSKQPKVPDANNMTTWRLDMSSAPGVWTTGPAFAQGRADFGLAYDAGTNKLYALGGDASGGGFFDSTNLVDELSVASWPAGSWVASPPNLILPNRQANQAGFYGSGQIWSVGGLVGQTFQFLAEVQRRTNGGSPCGTPTATPRRRPHSLRRRLQRQRPHSRQRRLRQQPPHSRQRRLRHLPQRLQQLLQPQRRQLRPYRRGLHRRHGLGRHRGAIRPLAI